MSLCFSIPWIPCFISCLGVHTVCCYLPLCLILGEIVSRCDKNVNFPTGMEMQNAYESASLRASCGCSLQLCRITKLLIWCFFGGNCRMSVEARFGANFRKWTQCIEVDLIRRSSLGSLDEMTTKARMWSMQWNCRVFDCFAAQTFHLWLWLIMRLWRFIKQFKVESRHRSLLIRSKTKQSLLLTCCHPQLHLLCSKSCEHQNRARGN